MPNSAPLLLSLLLLAGCVFAPALRAESGDFPLPEVQSVLERSKVTVAGPQSRPFIYTNKRAAFFFSETAKVDRDKGLTVAGQKVIEDYLLAVNGQPLDRASVASVDVYPSHLVRHYPGGITEEIALLDETDALVIFVRGVTRATLTPLVAAGGAGNQEQKTPRAMTVRAVAPNESMVADAASGAVETTGTGTLGFVIAVGATPAEAAALAEEVARDAAARVEARHARIGQLLLDTHVETADARFDQALAWLKAHGDALVTEQNGSLGIWAGLTWFNNNWGRDTFISLPGIALVTGRFAEARRILQDFAKYQQTDARSPLFGRLPNLVNSPTDIIYNTADGTPWFVREAYEYVLSSGDVDFARSIFPVIQRATEGTLRNHVDSHGLLTHGDADTWMDARWEGGAAWSPRGDRAVDIQALWQVQLDASARLARLVSDLDAAARWEKEATRVAASFRRLFREPVSGVLYDHLEKDGSPDRQVRPNGIFALTVPFRPLLSTAEGVPILRQVMNELTYPHGVASLAQSDPHFHPYHHDSRWHFDAAYHNGTVWVWNSGPIITALVRAGRRDLAGELTQGMVNQALDLGVVGALPELVEAVPREDGKLTLSGAVLQAWSVAEFVRNFYQDYLGVHPDALNNTLRLDPRLPESLGAVRAVLPFKEDRIKATFARTADGKTRVRLFAAKLATPLQITLHDAQSAKLRAGEELVLEAAAQAPEVPAAAVADLRFATPTLLPSVRKLLNRRAGDPERLSAADCAAPEPANAQLLYLADDPATSTGIRVTANAERYYFALHFRAPPGTGSEQNAGSPRPFAAIAIATGDASNAGSVIVGKRAFFVLPPSLAYDRIIYAGDGIEVEDDSGHPIAIYRPENNSANSAATGKMLRFSLPRRVLGEHTSKWQFTVLTGDWEDDGAGGPGCFRDFLPRTGGGTNLPPPGEPASRVRDILFPPEFGQP